MAFTDSTQRLMADNPDNQTAVSFTNQVDAASMQQVADDPKIKARSTSGYQPYVGVMNFNMQPAEGQEGPRGHRLRLPTQAILDAYGTPGGGELAGSYISPTLTGYKDIDPYGKLKKPLGDIEKAKKLLKDAGKTGMKLTYAHNTATEPAKYSVAVVDNLKKAGFDVQSKELPLGHLLRPHRQGGQQVRPVPVCVGCRLAQLADGAAARVRRPADPRRRQRTTRATTTPRSTRKSTGSSRITDRKKAADEWFALGEKILKDDLPQIPTFYYKQIQLHGSKVGGVVNNDVISSIDPTKLYVKK